MKVYACRIDSSLIDETEPLQDYHFSSLAEARTFARDTLLSDPEDIDCKIEIRRLEIIVTGHDWLLAILNRKGYVRSRKEVELWQWSPAWIGPGAPFKIKRVPQ